MQKTSADFMMIYVLLQREMHIINLQNQTPSKNLHHQRAAVFVPAASVLNILEGKLGRLKPTALRARTLKV